MASQPGDWFLSPTHTTTLLFSKMELDLCEHFQADRQKSLFVTGIERHCIGDDITNFSEVNGTISKVARVPDEPRQPEGRTLRGSYQF